VSRTGRIARALTVGYGYQAMVVVVGLWLVPFFLGRLGKEDYGLWLVVGQVLGYLSLLDLGVTAVLPREVAAASGAADRAERVPEVVRRAAWLVGLQTPLVAVAAAAAWAGVGAARPELAGPLAVILAAYVLLFPLRLFGGVLNGLQDLAFAGGLQVAGWAVTTATSVGLVLAGWGLYALAGGWAAGQVTAAMAGWWRVRARFPQARPRGGWPGWAGLRRFMGVSLWSSVRAVAQLLLNGTELIVLAWAVGPAAVVAYVCTTKLVAVVNNQPYLLVSSAMPAMAELRAGGDRDRLWRACRALGVGMMLLSGALAVAVAAATPAFVPRWVGPDQYAGPAVTLLAVLVMVARHWTYTLLQTAYALGHDRLLALVAMADGLATTAATAGWVLAVGVVGVPLGSLTGLALTNAPFAVWAVATLAGVSPLRVAGWLAPWAARFAAVFAPVAALTFTPEAGSVPSAAGLLLGGLGAYAALAYPLLNREPLRGYREQMLSGLRRKFRPTPAGSPP
jgi:O-antigen/teichoic acid export membrane protein